MKTFSEKVARRVWAWAISTVVVLGVLLAMGYAFLSLVDDVARQRTYLELVGGLFIVLAFIFGQMAERILVRSWDTMIQDLGPTQIEVMVAALEQCKKDLEAE